MPSKLRFLLACTISLLAAAAQAQTTIHVPADQPTIQAGINAAHNGDTVLVAPGTYYENINFKGKAITVTSSGGASTTTIDGGGLGSTVTIDTQEPRTAVLSNFTVTHGGLSNPGIASFGVAGIRIYNSTPTILNNIVTQNYCQNISASDAAPLIQGNLISSSLIAAQCFVLNTGGISMGGEYYTLSGKAPSPLIIGNTIENNITGEFGDGGGDGGAGIWVDAGTNIVIEGNVIRNNTTHTGNGGGIFVFNAGPVAIVNNLIYGNYAGCGGGAISFEATGSTSPYTFLIANNTISDNTGGTGGGYTNCAPIAQIYPNSFSYGAGGPSSAIINNIISGSSSYPAINCSIFGPLSESDQPTIQNNILYNAGGPFFGSYCVDVSGKYNNIVADPQFVSPTTGDYHIRNTSPAIDSGQNNVIQAFLSMTGMTLPTDFDGNPRIQDAIGKGCIIDMGAYEYAGTQSACSTTETLQSSLNPSISGQNVTFTAQLTSPNGVPTGDVQFLDGSTALSTQIVSGTGSSTFSTNSLAIGIHNITANYQPIGAFGAASAALTQVITGYPTTTTLTCPPNPLYLNRGYNPIITVTSSNGTPTGSITLTDNGTQFGPSLPLFNGSTGNMYFGTVVGPHTLTATYVPTGAFGPSSATCTFVVALAPTTTTITSSLNPSTAGQNVTFTAVVIYGGPPPILAGPASITFSDGVTPLQTVNISAPATTTSTATYTTSALTAGSHTITATLNPPAAFASSTATLTQVVNGLPTTSILAAAPTTASFGSPITLTATVAPATKPGPTTPTGTVTFYNGSSAIGSAPLSAAAIATLVTSTLPVGTDNLTCLYSGDSVYNSSPCNIIPVVITITSTALTLTSSANPSSALTPIGFTAHLTANGQPAPAGNTIAIAVNGQSTDLLTDATGSAALTTPGLNPGTYPVSASFAATSSLAASSASLSQVVTALPTATTLTASPNPAYVSQTVTLTATVTASNGQIPTGSITFYDASTPLGTVTLNASAQATMTTSTLAIGTHPLNAVYTPTAPFAGSTSPIVQEVILASGFTLALSPTTITLPPGQPGTVAILLTSVGNFSGPLALTYGPLPTYATASISPSTVTLTAGGTANSMLTLNTLLKASNQPPARPGSRSIPVALAATLLLLTTTRRKRLSRLLTLLLAAALFQPLTGCVNAFYTVNVVAPGTYQVSVTATDVNHNTQTGTVTVAVTP